MSHKQRNKKKKGNQRKSKSPFLFKYSNLHKSGRRERNNGKKGNKEKLKSAEMTQGKELRKVREKGEC